MACIRLHSSSNPHAAWIGFHILNPLHNNLSGIEWKADIFPCALCAACAYLSPELVSWPLNPQLDQQRRPGLHLWARGLTGPALRSYSWSPGLQQILGCLAILLRQNRSSSALVACCPPHQSPCIPATSSVKPQQFWATRSLNWSQSGKGSLAVFKTMHNTKVPSQSRGKPLL